MPRNSNVEQAAIDPPASETTGIATEKKLRLAVVLPNVAAGGAERVTSLLCNAWAQAGHEVTVVTFETPSGQHFYSFDASVTIRQLAAINENRRLLSRLAVNGRRILRLRKVLRDSAADAILAFTTEANVIALLAALGLGIPALVSERNQPNRPALGRVHRAARHATYPLASAIIVQTEPIAAWAREQFRVPVYILPNPIELASWRDLPREETPNKQIAAVGRLVPQKGFDRLIASFSQVADGFPQWHLTIYGEGPERRSLEARIQHFGLDGRVHLPGLQSDIGLALANADLFALSSRYEGAPNALLEALAAGCAVIATDCPGAVSDILGGGEYGLLVDSSNDVMLTEGLARMMSDGQLRQRYAVAAPTAVARFDVKCVAESWLKVVRRHLSGR